MITNIRSYFENTTILLCKKHGKIDMAGFITAELQIRRDGARRI